MGFTRGRGEAPTKKWKEWRGKERKKRCMFTCAPCPLGIRSGVAEATHKR